MIYSIFAICAYHFLVVLDLEVFGPQPFESVDRRPSVRPRVRSSTLTPFLLRATRVTTQSKGRTAPRHCGEEHLLLRRLLGRRLLLRRGLLLRRRLLHRRLLLRRGLLESLAELVSRSLLVLEELATLGELLQRQRHALLVAIGQRVGGADVLGDGLRARALAVL